MTIDRRGGAVGDRQVGESRRFIVVTVVDDGGNPVANSALASVKTIKAKGGVGPTAKLDTPRWRKPGTSTRTSTATVGKLDKGKDIPACDWPHDSCSSA